MTNDHEVSREAAPHVYLTNIVSLQSSHNGKGQAEFAFAGESSSESEDEELVVSQQPRRVASGPIPLAPAQSAHR